jgi:hypothetical protein
VYLLLRVRQHPQKEPICTPGPVNLADYEKLTDFAMLHRRGLLALERLVLHRELTTRALFLLLAMAARLNITTGRVWATASELAAEHEAIPGCVCSSIRRLRLAGLVVRCTAPPPSQLSARERASIPDPATRAPHSARVYFLIHPGLISVGGKTRRHRLLRQFQEAMGDRVTPFSRELRAIEAEAEAQEVAQLVAESEARQARQAKLRPLEDHRSQLEQMRCHALAAA